MIDDLEIKVNLGFFRFTRAIRPLAALSASEDSAQNSGVAIQGCWLNISCHYMI